MPSYQFLGKWAQGFHFLGLQIFFDHSDWRASSLKSLGARTQSRKNRNKYNLIQVGLNSEQLELKHIFFLNCAHARGLEALGRKPFWDILLNAS